jgi:hypothetical protein
LQNRRTHVRWRLGLLAAFAVMLLSLYPQINLWLVRGADWQGAYAHIDSDEVAYSAYLAALIDGRPRRNDPYTGRDDAPGSSQSESLFSIQFIEPFVLALIARLLSLPASTVFILLAPLVALAASLAIFWLMVLTIEDERVAATAVLVVLCLGTFGPVYVAWQGLRGMDTTYAYSYFPFLRRFQPAASFPFFFLFCAVVWRALRSDGTRVALVYGAAGCFVFALLLFSYFYLWTAAMAWLFCLALLIVAARPGNWRQDIRRVGLLSTTCAATLIPYYILLRNRAPTMDSTQLLALSRRPDLFHWSEILGLFVIVATAWAWRRGLVDGGRHVAVFASSLALVPFVVFNQQVITGRSLQPLHYDLYIAKYVALVALVLCAALLWRGGRHEAAASAGRFPGKILFWIALAALGWGWVEGVVATDRYLPVNVSLDRSRIAARRLAEMAQDAGQVHPVALSTDLMLADSLPTDAPLAVLWAPHLQVFSGAAPGEHKQRIHQYLYYTGVSFAPGDEEQDFSHLDPRKRYFISSLVGWGRSDPAWNVGWRPIAQAEVRAELRAYGEFTASFDLERASHPTLSYVVLPAWQQQQADLSNLDRWYERDGGERAGDHIIYRVRLRP